MSFQPAKDAVIKVDTGGGSFAKLEGVTDWEDSREYPESETDILGQSAPLRLKGRNDFSVSVTCVHDPAGPAQQALRDAAANDNDIAIQVLPDGTSGEQFDVAVTNQGKSGSASQDEYQEQTFEMNARHTTVTSV